MNNDLISRSALIAEYDRVHVGEPGTARKLMEDAPAVDAVLVEHGVWIYKDFTGLDYYTTKGAWCCSHCGYLIESKSKYQYVPDAMRYCPYCGAKMDGDVDENHL